MRKQVIGIEASLGLQQRIGRLLGAFCLFFAIYNTIKSRTPLNFETISFSVESFFFFWSYESNKIWLQYVQVIILFYEGFYTTYLGETFFGLSILFIGILLSKQYGWYRTETLLKVILFSTVCIFIFASFPLREDENRYIRSISWCIFLGTYLLIFMTIFKNEKEKVEKLADEQDDILLKKLDEVTRERDRALELNADLLALAKEMNEKVKVLCQKGREK